MRNAFDNTNLFNALAFPLERNAEFLRGGGGEVADAVVLAGGDDEIFGLLLLQHQPLGLDEVARMAPVALGVEVAEIEAILQAEPDARERARDLACHEGLAARGALRG